jgi:hypothetical protein
MDALSDIDVSDNTEDNGMPPRKRTRRTRRPAVVVDDSDSHSDDNGVVDEAEGAGPQAISGRQARQERDRKSAEEASSRSTAFLQMVNTWRAPTLALHGIKPWVRPGMGYRHIEVEFAKVDACKVPVFGSTLKGVDGSDVAFLPTPLNTLVIEAGCSAEKTRHVLKWLVGKLDARPDMPVLFITCRKTHADDLYATLESFGIGGFKNYMDAKGEGESKTAYMSDATRLIVSLQSLHLIELPLYVKGLVVIDEVRSAFSIPGGETLPQPAVQMQRLRTLFANAEYRVLMDADVSADGAVHAGLRIIAPTFNVLHVQLQQAALKRVMSLSFVGPKGSTGKSDWMDRLTLWLRRVRRVRDEWISKQRAKKHAAKSELWLLERKWDKHDKKEGDPDADVKREREWQRQRLDKMARPADLGRVYGYKLLQLLRERQWRREDTEPRVAQCPEDVKREREWQRQRLRQRECAARFDRQRALICCATRTEATKVAEMCRALGVPYRYYTGTTSDKEKRDHFKNTTEHWFDVAVIIATTTMTVAVNVRIHFSVVFLRCTKGDGVGKLRELAQAVVRAGRDEDDPLEDIHIYTLIPGDPPDFSEFKPLPQERRFGGILYELKKKSVLMAACEAEARVVYQSIGGRLDEGTPTLSDPLLELIAWSRLEESDNAGNMFLVKLIELCMLTTRDWSIKITPALSPEEQAESEELAREAAPLPPDQTEDERVGEMSISESFEWLHTHLDQKADNAANERVADATIDVDDVRREKMVGEEKKRLSEEYMCEQENLRHSKEARPEKDARDIAKENIYRVIEPLGHLPELNAFHSGWVGQLAHDDTMSKLQRRAAASVMPIDEQRKVYERLRRKGTTAHPVVVTPWHTHTQWLEKLASLLKLHITRLLGPTTFTDDDEWVQVGVPLQLPSPCSPFLSFAFLILSYPSTPWSSLTAAQQDQAWVRHSCRQGSCG